MSSKKVFIEQIERLISEGLELDEEAKAFFEDFKSAEKDKPELTEKGSLILSYMKDNIELFNNIFKSKDIADGIEINGRSVSGSMKKLMIDGFVDKIGTNPVCYAVTEKGKEYKFN